MDRRDFLGTAAAAGIGITLSGRSVAGQARGVEEATVAQLQSMMQRGQITAKRLTDTYLKRIASVDKMINSVIEVNPEALAIADQLDRERKAGKVRGPLHGIPVLLKDNIDTADKMKTTAGSLALADAPTPKQDAFIVARLREAGAVILGKTNLSEWANFRDSSSISGWSGRGGQTRNPYVLDRNPCGSSSGTGAAVSANLSALGVGTETNGSIVCPSSVCGIVGLKPTVGLVSRSGIIPIAAEQDTAGPMTRTVSDAAAMLNVLAGTDGADAATLAAGKYGAVDYTSYLRPDSLRGARIGVARDYWGRRADVDVVMNAALESMKKAGAELIDVKFPNLGRIGDPSYLVLQYEFKDGLEKYLAARGSRHRTLDDLIKFNSENAAKEMPYFKQSIMESSAKKGPLTSQEYIEALATARKYSREEGIDKVMDEHRLDAIVGPSNAPAWLVDTVNGDCRSGYVSSSSPAAVAGYPNITVPAGFFRELPIGISFFGRAWSEGKLIGIAYAFEQVTKARRAPKFLTTYV